MQHFYTRDLENEKKNLIFFFVYKRRSLDGLVSQYCLGLRNNSALIPCKGNVFSVLQNFRTCFRANAAY